MGVRDLHSKDSYPYPLARDGSLDRLCHFLCECAEAGVGGVVKIEYIVFLGMFGDDEGVSLGHWGDVEEGVVVFVLGDFVGWDLALGYFGENCCH